MSSGSGSNDTSAAAQAQGDEPTPNSWNIELVGKDGTKWEYSKFSLESRGRVQAQNVLTESQNLT